MAGTGRNWLIGCGVGCGVAVLLSILITVGGGILMTRPFNRAVTTQRELTESLGERSDYLPPLAGLEKAQLKHFHAVRLELEPLCAKFEEVAEKFQAMDGVGGDGEDPSAGEVLHAVGGVMGAVMGMAGNIGRHTELRNRALLEQDMSLGEYVWIYVLVYNSWLEYAPNSDFESDGEDESFTRKERRLIRDLLDNHVQSLTEAGRTQEAAVWQRESDMVMDSVHGVPFEESGLPPEMAERLEPFRERFDALYCAEAASFEFAVIRKKGLSFHSE